MSQDQGQQSLPPQEQIYPGSTDEMRPEPGDKMARYVGRKFGEHVPMSRPAQPDEIAPSFVFLPAETLSSYYSGEILAPLEGEVHLAAKMRADGHQVSTSTVQRALRRRGLLLYRATIGDGNGRSQPVPPHLQHSATPPGPRRTHTTRGLPRRRTLWPLADPLLDWEVLT